VRAPLVQAKVAERTGEGFGEHKVHSNCTGMRSPVRQDLEAPACRDLLGTSQDGPKGVENMKTAALVLVSLLLLVAPAASQTTNDNLVVPGVRIGKWTLQMTIDDLLRMNGPGSPQLFNAGCHLGLSARRDFWLYPWALLAFGADTFDQKKVEVLIAGIGGGVVPFKIDKGLTLLQSKRSDILTVYRKPTVVLKGAYGQSDLIYDKIGLGFRVSYDGGRIRLIYVFRPGTAKSLWKF
jgi:hypothetical protein